VKRNAIALLASASLILLFSACGDQNGNIVRPSSDTQADQFTVAESMSTDVRIQLMSEPIQELLRELWEASNHSDWEVLSGDIYPHLGGTISGVPDSWAAQGYPDYEFRVEIPAFALPEIPAEPVPPAPRGAPDDPEGRAIELAGRSRDEALETEPIEISIWIPRYDDSFGGGVGYPAVYLLEPHGMQFQQPVTVTLCYPPWLPSSMRYDKFYFWRQWQGGDWTYFFSDLETVTGGGDPRTEITYQTWHFSRWGMQNGTGGNGKTAPSGKGGFPWGN